MSLKICHPLPLTSVQVEDGFFTPFQTLVREVVIPYQEQVLNDAVPGAAKSHAMENFRIAAGISQGEFYGAIFQDSDVAKWLEAAAYSLTTHPDPALESRCDEVINIIEKAQEPDGYLDTYFMLKSPELRFTNLEEGHEMYCAGHMTEAGVAYFQATGKDRLLKVVEKMCDLFCEKYGEGKTTGYPGHPELELALVRLSEVTGKKKYTELAEYFINQRGQDPDFFFKERKIRNWRVWPQNPNVASIFLNHAPIREMKTIEGHAVRALYLLTGVADVAALTEDRSLLDACHTLWRNMVDHRMYVTGGVGQTGHGEAFTIDDDLPNDANYAETCASVALCFFANRMLQMEPIGEYADVMELAYYNGTISGMQLDGRHFFYCNPLEVVPGVSGKLFGYEHMLPKRPEWYGCACCPPNLARLLMSLSNYAWAENETILYNHLFVGGKVRTKAGGGAEIHLQSNYPWNGDLTYTVYPKEQNCSFTLAVRVPGWCKKYTFLINGTEFYPEIRDGYAYISRAWESKDILRVSLEMQVTKIYANTAVRADAGCVALKYGPLVYAFESVDNGNGLQSIRIPRSADGKVLPFDASLLSGIRPIEIPGIRMETSSSLYSSEPPKETPVTLRAVPYYAWGNRGDGEMRVWMHESAY